MTDAADSDWIADFRARVHRDKELAAREAARMPVEEKLRRLDAMREFERLVAPLRAAHLAANR